MLQYTKEVISLSEKRTHYPTIKDVAKLANTSTATVSYILNEDASRPISQEPVSYTHLDVYKRQLPLLPAGQGAAG